MQIPIPKKFRQRIERQKSPDERNLNETLEKSINSINSKIDNSIPEELQGGEVVEVDIKSGNNVINHNLKRFPEGFIVLNGCALTEVSSTKDTYTLSSSTVKNGCKIWIF